MKKYIFVKRAAEMVGVSAQTIRNLCKQKALSHKVTPKGIMVSEEDVKKLSYKIKEYDANLSEIDAILENSEKFKDELYKVQEQNRIELLQVGLYPSRIRAIRDILRSVLQSNYQDELPARDFEMMMDALNGNPYYDISSKYTISKQRALQIWQKALRRLAIARSVVMQKDAEIAELQRTICELRGKLTEPTEDSKLLDSPILDVCPDMSVRALNCLRCADITTLRELVAYKRTDLLKFRNFGRKSMTEIDELLDKYGLQFNQ